MHVLAKHNTVDPEPQEIVRDLLRAEMSMTSTEAALAPLERRGRKLVERAAEHGIEIEYLGVNPLFDEARLYRGAKNDWVLAPATRTDDLVVPRSERETLRRLVAAGVDLPLIYIGHEVPKERTKNLSASTDGHTILDEETATEVVGPAPHPTEVVDTSNRLAGHADRTMRALARTVPVLGAAALAVAAAPLVLAAGAVAGLATVDPIILGALPMRTAKPGTPAAWLVLARWDW